MSIEIKRVSTPKELKQFINFFKTLYSSCEYAPIPLSFDEMETLKPDKNPAFKHCESEYLLALKDNKVVGRIAVIINRLECEKVNQKIGRFGWFDFIDDKAVSKALMEAGIAWLKERNITQLHGPLGFSDFDRQGMLLEGYDRLGTFATLYNYPYYIEHLEAFGFEKSIDWVEFRINIENSPLEKVQRIATIVEQRSGYHNIEIKTKKQLRKYFPDIFRLLNQGYDDLYGYVALTDEQTKHYAEMFINLVNLKLVCLIADRDEKVVAFGLTMPSLTKACQRAKGSLFPLGWWHLLKALKKNDTLDFYLIAVDKEHQKKGVTAPIMAKIANTVQEMNIKYAETNIMLETNKDIQATWHNFDYEQHKRRRCFIKTI